MTTDLPTMQGLVLHAVADLRVQAVPRPAVPPGWGLVRVGFCGVCGSDIPRIFKKGTYRFPTICGHEFAGVVEVVNDPAAAFHPGDRVAVFPLIWCGRCAACERGRYVQCEHYDYLGSRRDGGFAQYVAAPLQNLVPVPQGVSLEAAAMTEPAAVALHALRRMGGPLLDQTLAVFGAGPIGLMLAQWGRAMGAARILLFDVLSAKLDMARRLGFTDAFNSRDQDPVQAVDQITHGRGAHVTVDAAGVPATLLAALATARAGGRVVLLGNPSGTVPLPPALISQLMRREVTLLGTWNSDYSAAGSDDDWRTALAAMARGTLDVTSLITHQVGLEEAIAALKRMNEGKDFFAKVLIQP